jgi:O-antigen/teichoic acid export membrane protein
MKFSRWVVFTFVIHIFVIAIDKGAGLILFKILEDQPDVKGAADLLTILPFIMMAIANLGLATSLVYYVRRKVFGLTEVAETCSLVAFVWGSVVAVLAIVASQTIGPIIEPSWEWSLNYVIPISLCVPFLLTTSYFNSLQLAVGQIRNYNLIHLFSSGLFLPMFLLFYWLLPADEVPVSIAMARLVTAVAMSVLTVWMLRHLVIWRPRMHWTFFKAGVSYGWKANLTSVLTYLNHRIDLFVVVVLFVPGAVVFAEGGARGVAEAQLAQAAFYSLAVTFAEFVWHFPEATRDLFFSKVAGSNDKEAARFTPILCRLSLVASLLGGIAIYFLVDPLMSLLSPNAWEERWQETVLASLLVLLPGTVGFTVAKILQNDLAARGHIDRCLIATVTVLVVMLSLDVVWVPVDGAVGAAWASSIAYLWSAIYTLYSYRRCGGGTVWECLFVRPSDWVYVKQIFAAVIEKIKGRGKA